jgi:cell division protein ZapE
MPTRPMTPLERYRHDLERRAFSPDPAQREAAGYLQTLYEALLAEYQRRESRLARLRLSLGGSRPAPYRGIYLWGGVGRGKTWLVDSFHESLPFAQKTRLHFHRFMRRVHGELKELRNQRSPLLTVADRLAADNLVLCFDEFHVGDIADAMLLGGLLQALFERGVTLVATSNEHPDRLYSGGLQRERFLPAIAQLKQHAHVVHLDSATDYRMRYLEQAGTYHHPLDGSAGRMLAEHFERIAPDRGSAAELLDIEGRSVPTVRAADGVVWFTFEAICNGPRGAADYIEIARQYQTVLIGGVPQFDESMEDAARRFIMLVDEFYDRNVRLILTAAAPPDHLYAGRRHTVPFRRTASRLVEMQSVDYLSREHKSD